MLQISGNIVTLFSINFTKTWAPVTAATQEEQTVTIPGIRLATDVAIGAISKPVLQAGIIPTGFRVSADDTITVSFFNNTGGNITPTANEVYKIHIARRENVLTDAVG